MNKTTAIELVLLFIAGLVPLLWLKSGYIISNGDDFPIFLNPSNSFRTGTFLWSNAFLGSATPTPAYALYQYLSTFLVYLGLSVGYVQIIFQTFLFMLAGFSMYYFSKTVYPELKFAGFAAGFFYMFNFFALDNRRNIGFIWIYAFLPLLLVLFVKIVNATCQKDNNEANRNIIYFALISVVAFSFASINPANLVLMAFGLGIFVVYYLFKFRKHLRRLFISFGKIAGLTIPINLWWIIPILNYYFLSSQAFSSSISATAWSWTTERASFLNLFWLNGFWGWLSDYVPANTLSFYSYPVLVILVFAPFLVAASALLFRGEKSRFNAYVMGAILVLLFLAKGLNGWPNDLWIYKNISLMSIFREPTSKFTLLMMPFLALLIGYAVGNFANVKIKIAGVKIKRLNFRLTEVLVVSLVLMMFVATVFPLIINPVETRTQKLPFSSYVKIPDYWLQAANWINSQQGDGKVLITPLDDFYQMPYTWGYYGTDQMIDSLIDKPIVSTASLNGYKISLATDNILEELNYTMYYNSSNSTVGFKALLDLLDVQYILQRNDVEYNFNGRNIMSPAEVQRFFAEQPYLRLVERFGQLDIFKYTEAKSSVYAISPSSLLQSGIAIETNTTFEHEWDFSSAVAVKDWKATAYSNQTQSASILSQDGNYLKAELSNSTGYLEKIETSPLLAKNATNYAIQAYMKEKNVYVNNITIVQYDANMNIINNTNNIPAVGVDFGPLNSTNTQFTFSRFSNTAYLSIQVWFSLDTNQTSQGILWLSNVGIIGQIHPLNTAGLDNVFNDTLQHQTATILNVQKLNPTKIVVTVNASHPFILATTQAFDGFWVAYANGKQVTSTALYLGLQGFEIEKTGQFDITLEYEPQLWFYYAAVISVSVTAAICALYVYINREVIRGILKGTNMRKRR